MLQTSSKKLLVLRTFLGLGIFFETFEGPKTISSTCKAKYCSRMLPLKLSWVLQDDHRIKMLLGCIS